MFRIGYIIVLLPFICLACSQKAHDINVTNCAEWSSDTLHMDKGPAVRGALLSTRYESYDELKKVISVDYTDGGVRLIHCSNGKAVESVLKPGISEQDFADARDGNFWDRLQLIFKSPYSVRHRKDLQAVHVLSRRRPDIFGAGDPAFYDLSASFMSKITSRDSSLLNTKDLTSEKGYFNIINHISAQAFTTAIFSERLADLIADAHERKTLPELITGNFSHDQISDLENGPLDNYIDMINNEWGQELGKQLKSKYNIKRETLWTPGLLVNFLNDLLRYYSWSFQIGFNPFQIDDEVVVRFANKINGVLNGKS